MIDCLQYLAKSIDATVMLLSHPRSIIGDHMNDSSIQNIFIFFLNSMVNQYFSPFTCITKEYSHSKTKSK